MKRIAGWRRRAAAVITGLERAPHAYGSVDCAAGLGARWVEALTGEDWAAEFRGRYTSLEEGLALLQAAGFADLAAFVASKLPQIHLSKARYGDLVLLPVDGGGWAVGIIKHGRIGVLTPNGYGTIDGGRANAETGALCFGVGGDEE